LPIFTFTIAKYMLIYLPHGTANNLLYSKMTIHQFYFLMIFDYHEVWMIEH